VDAFAFHLDPHRSLLTVVMRGFWDLPTYLAYDAQISEQLKILGHLPPPRGCLIDAREFAVQSQELMNQMIEGLHRRLPLYPERTARVVTSAVARSQATRVGNAVGQGVFSTIEAATAWLMEEGSAVPDQGATA
jgi:hypothetical protein